MVRAYLKCGTADVRSSLNASLCIALVETTACAMFQHALVQGIGKAAVILTAWLTTRRTAESAYISWDCTFYEATFASAYIAMYQSNVDEGKPFPFVAGECMLLCWCPSSRPATVPASSSRSTRASPAEPRPAARPLGPAQRAPHGAHLGSRKSHSNLGRNRRSSAADGTKHTSAAGRGCRPRRGPRRPTRGPRPGPSARRSVPRTARTSDRERGCGSARDVVCAAPEFERNMYMNANRHRNLPLRGEA